MPKFPTTQNDIIALAQVMYKGYVLHIGDFPNISIFKLVIKRNNFNLARKNQIQTLTDAKLATEAKEKGLDTLIKLMKGCLRKSEVDVAGTPEKLAYIGWTPKSAAQPTEKPGQPKNLRASGQEKTTLQLKWDKPQSGGKVQDYIIERRIRLTDNNYGTWSIIDTAFDTGIKLSNQPCGAELEYRVTSENHIGKSTPSNIVEAIL